MEPINSSIINNDLELVSITKEKGFIFNQLIKSVKDIRQKLIKTQLGKKIFLILLFFLSPVFFFYLFLFIQDNILATIPQVKSEYWLNDNKSYEQLKKKTLNDIVILQEKLNRKTPGATYLVINSSTNEFKLYSGVKEIRKGICSTGSYTLLVANDNKQWLFKTPRGVLRVQGKTENPLWIKPDWAFIEEGLPVPSKSDNSRYEYGSLGDYALSLGKGYLIHGTLYKRFLGLPVTHGCVRMNDEDLAEIYKTLNIGSKVFIY